jgi:hypothetical protein
MSLALYQRLNPRKTLLQKVLFAICAAYITPTFMSTPSEASSSDFDGGKKFLESKDYEKALPLLDKSVDDDPTNGDYHFWRGKCLAALGKAKEACAEFKLAALLSTDSKVREACKKEFAQFKQDLPAGSVNSRSAIKSDLGADSKDSDSSASSTKPKDNLFKLTSKKLDWNLEMKQDYLNSMKSRTDNLSRLALSGRSATQMPNLSAAARDLLNGQSHFQIPLSKEEKGTLLNCDIMLILDHSGSMRTMDCPSSLGGVESRIGWCVEELDQFADSLSAAMPHGFHLLTFESRPEIYRINSANELRQVLASLKANGGTDLAGALQQAFRLHSTHMDQALLIGVISDGEVDLQSCRDGIVEATKRFPLPNGVFITLLQVGAGAEIHTSDRISMLDNLKERASASYDAFVGVPFSKLRRDGLGRDLLLGLRVNYPALAEQLFPPAMNTAGQNRDSSALKPRVRMFETKQTGEGKAAKSSQSSANTRPVKARSVDPKAAVPGSAANSASSVETKIPVMWTDDGRSKK